MNRAIKIRVYPNQNQKEVLDKTFGCCRFIYNKMLEERIQSYREWTCPECNAHHNRDVNASLNIKEEGVKILKKNSITIMNNDYAVGTTVNAFGEDVRLSLGEQFSMNYESTTFR